MFKKKKIIFTSLVLLVFGWTHFSYAVSICVKNKVNNVLGTVTVKSCVKNVCEELQSGNYFQYSNLNEGDTLSIEWQTMVDKHWHQKKIFTIENTGGNYASGTISDRQTFLVRGNPYKVYYHINNDWKC